MRALIVVAALGLLLTGSAQALEVGDRAPEFTLNNQDGKPVKLSELVAKGPVVIYTFFAAFTST